MSHVTGCGGIVDPPRPSPRAGTRLAALLVVTAMLAGCQPRPLARPNPSPLASASESAPATSAHTIKVNGASRTYQLYRPPSIKGRRVPLVVMLHGALGTGTQAKSSYGWDSQAERAGFAVAYPDGLNRSWAVSNGCCGPSAASKVDEVAFIRHMVTEISARTPIDPDRIYATGISNGGMLAYRLACDTNIFAAIGPTSATMLGPCPHATPTSVIHIHGAQDRTIPYQGGPGKRSNDGTGPRPADTDGPPIPTLIATWSAIDRCGEPTIKITGVINRSTATCQDGREVVLVTISNAGHQWPGQPGPNGPVAKLLDLDSPSMALDATEVIWRFFSEHPRPAR